MSDYHPGPVWILCPSTEVHVLQYIVNQVRLRHFDLPFREGLNVDADVVVEGPLVVNIKLRSDLRDFLEYFCAAWRGKYAVVHVEEEDTFTLI